MAVNRKSSMDETNDVNYLSTKMVIKKDVINKNFEQVRENYLCIFIQL